MTQSKVAGHLGLPNSQKCDQSPVFCRIGNFKTFHLRFLACCQTAPLANQKGRGVVIGLRGTGAFKSSLHNIHPICGPAEPRCTVRLDIDALVMPLEWSCPSYVLMANGIPVGFTSNAAKRNYEIRQGTPISHPQPQ